MGGARASYAVDPATAPTTSATTQLQVKITEQQAIIASQAQEVTHLRATPMAPVKTNIDYAALVGYIIGISGCIIAGFSFYIARKKYQSDIRPVLVFTRRDDGTGKKEWQIENVGNGPALRIQIGDQDSKGWENVQDYYPLAAGTRTSLQAVYIGNVLAAVYSDADNYYYTSGCRGNQSNFFKGNKYPDWIPKGTETEPYSYLHKAQCKKAASGIAAMLGHSGKKSEL
jgi:hypothetical protein